MTRLTTATLRDDFRIVQIPQCDGRYRVVALAMPDWRGYQADRAILDSIRPLGCLDVSGNGREEWGATGPRDREIDPVVRHALRAMRD